MATSKSGTSTTPTAEADGGFTKAEREAMKDRAAELRAAKGGRGAEKAAAAARAVVERIEGMPEPDRLIAARLHEIITSTAPGLAPKLWYGMPAYARDGKIVCFVQGAAKFESRYSTLGFNDAARLDEGSMWPTSWAISEIAEADEAVIRALVARAVSRSAPGINGHG